MPRLVARDQALALGEPREREPLVLRGGEILRGARDHALGEQVVDDHRREELVLVRGRREAPDVMLEAGIQRLGDEIHVAVGDLAHGVDPAVDAEDLVVDAQDGLQVAVLVRDLRRQQELHVVARRREQERRQQPGDAELGVEAVREDPDHARLRARVERLEAAAVGLEVERERRPLIALPVCVEGAERGCSPLQCGDLGSRLRIRACK